MDDLLALAPIIAVVLGWLFSNFKKDRDEKKARSEAKPVQSSTRHTTTSNDSSSVEIGTETKTDLQTYAERQRERYKDNQSRTTPSSAGEISDSKHNALKDEKGHNYYERDDETPYQQGEDSPYERDQYAPYQRDQLKPYRGDGGKPKVKLSGVQKLSQKKLAQSIIMAEVLGPPRSQKPYRSK
ncbi:hypothetical protein [Pontibacillus sp. HMF3514]|uniref:hypothetical protein n=1 Tax=Pontibacillus sp. HMF3514 TaxID=2692425 RepID=UPI00131FDDCA|nr:hypothetical protein [Pontibacillus sp. HMF3514]QHE53006.1 hypothetical protein GS400_13690 [Pontibacillus sp. HMF3514]